MIFIHFQGKPFNITVIQVCVPTSNAEETEVERFFEDLQDLLELTPKKDALFIKGDWNAKVGSQETPGIIGKFGLGMQNEEEQRQIEICQRKCTGHSKHPLPATQETSPDGQHQNQTDYILCSQNGEALYNQQKRDQELTVAQIMNSLLPDSDSN